MQSHLEWIEQDRPWALLAGSMRDAPGQPAVGGLWVVEAGSKAEAPGKVTADPLWANGLRHSVVEVFFWAMASADMQSPAEAMAGLRRG